MANDRQNGGIKLLSHQALLTVIATCPLGKTLHVTLLLVTINYGMYGLPLSIVFL